MSKMTTEEMNKFFRESFQGRPQPWPNIVEVGNGYVKVELNVGPAQLRPGGFINGPTQMGIADQAAYAVIFTQIGSTPMALTSNLNIDFLRPCLGEKLIAEGEMIKRGRSLAIMSVTLRGDKNDKISSRATVTYALPQSKP